MCCSVARSVRLEEVKEFVETLGTLEKALANVAAPDRMLFDTEWEGSPAEQFQRATVAHGADVAPPNHAGLFLAAGAYGRMAQANDLLLRSQRLGGTPVIQAETSWRYFQWKLQYDASRLDAHGAADLHMVRGLQSVANSEMEWLGAIPPDALIEIRKEGALGEIRHILGNGVEAIASAKPDAFCRTADRIVDNIHAAFDAHKRNLAQLRDKRWRFAGKELGSWLVVGTMGIAAAATGSPVYGLLAVAADQILNAPKLRELPSRIAALREEAQGITRSPVGLLFAARERAKTGRSR